jgi:hypothetical protein
MILLISLFASFFFPKVIHEELDKKVLLPKIAALILTVIGVVLVSF